jgi:hypothetical protein
MAHTESVLQSKLKSNAERYSESQRVRLHRAISWLTRAELETSDLDAQFIFVWIAFNAAYAKAIWTDESERGRLADFIQSLVSIDHEKKLYDILFQKFTGPVRTLLDNKFVFEPFWKALRDHDPSNRWEENFASRRKVALGAIVEGDAAKVLGIVFDRLYVLRNQLVHGGATWNSSVNRAQIKDGAAIMLAITPIIIGLMLDHPELDLGEIMYPVI